MTQRTLEELEKSTEDPRNIFFNIVTYMILDSLKEIN